MPTITDSQWFESLEIAAQEYLRLSLKESDLRNKGEDDPATDEWKCASMARSIAGERYRELSKPREILGLVKQHADLRTQLALKDKALEKIPSLIPTNWLDSLLTGPDAVRLSCPNGEVETLLLAVKARIEKHIAQSLSPSMTDAKTDVG